MAIETNASNDRDDSLEDEIIFIEGLLTERPNVAPILSRRLGEIDEEARIDIARLMRIRAVRLNHARLMRRRKRLTAQAAAVMAAVVTAPLLTTIPAEAAEAAHTMGTAGYLVAQAATPVVVRVVDTNSGQPLAGVKVKTVDESVVAVTDGNGQAIIPPRYTEESLFSLERTGYPMVLVESNKLAARSVVTMHRFEATGEAFAQAPRQANHLDPARNGERLQQLATAHSAGLGSVVDPILATRPASGVDAPSLNAPYTTSNGRVTRAIAKVTAPKDQPLKYPAVAVLPKARKNTAGLVQATAVEPGLGLPIPPVAPALNPPSGTLDTTLDEALAAMALDDQPQIAGRPLPTLPAAPKLANRTATNRIATATGTPAIKAPIRPTAEATDSPRLTPQFDSMSRAARAPQRVVKVATVNNAKAARSVPLSGRPFPVRALKHVEKMASAEQKAPRAMQIVMRDAATPLDGLGNSPLGLTAEQLGWVGPQMTPRPEGRLRAVPGAADAPRPALLPPAPRLPAVAPERNPAPMQGHSPLQEAGNATRDLIGPLAAPTVDGADANHMAVASIQLPLAPRFGKARPAMAAKDRQAPNRPLQTAFDEGAKAVEKLPNALDNVRETLKGRRVHAYRVRPGDMLYTIAARELGSADLWPVLYAANRDQLTNPSWLPVGTVLKLPRTSRAFANAGARSHVVVPGDTLSHIAKAYLGDARKWPQVYAANRHIIRNPWLIYPGQRLVIPVRLATGIDERWKKLAASHEAISEKGHHRGA